MKITEIKKRFIQLFSINILTKSVGFLLLPIYLNLMSPEEFGNYSYVISIVEVMFFIFGFGQYTTINRFYHSSEYTKDALVENVQLIVFTSFIFCCCILIIFKNYIFNIFPNNSINDVIFYSMLALSMLRALNQLIMVFLYQSENIKTVQIKLIVEFFIINILSLCFLYLLPLPKNESRILAMLMSYFIIITLYYRFFIKKNNFKFKNRTIEFYKRGVINGLPVAIGSCSNFFINFGDRLVIGKLLDSSFLGIFSFAIVIVNILMLIFYSFQSVWLPYFFKEKNLDISFKRAYKIIFIFFGISILLGGAFYALVYILATYFIQPIYIKSLSFLWLLVLASFFQIAGMMMTGFYQIYEKSYIAVPVNTLSGVLNIVMNYYFTNKYGILGAALSTAIISIILFVAHFGLVNFYKGRGNYGEYFTTCKISK
ncbi:lipopolysaccharide biosynthesis protein [Celerinatantimonas sp. YJH-8]|uniref:lipopolysaccharide biosynthesis protein n=1 Tax=Celerinatantimonas sp. YJH-8 TaxID=3228714 RepID=UPI0038C76CF0